MNQRQIAMRATVAAVLIALSLVVSIAYADTITIDTFDDDVSYFRLQVQDRDGRRFDADEGAHSSILGGEHDAELELFTDGDGTNTEVIRAPVNGYDDPVWGDYIDLDQLQYIADPDAGVTGVLTVTWDGNDNDGGTTLDPDGLDPDGSGPGVTNLVDGTNDGILMTVLSADQDSVVSLKAYSDGSNWSEASISVPACSADQLERFDLFFPFDDTSLWTDTGSGVDWQDLGALVLVIEGDSALDFVIDNLEATTAREYGDLPSSYGTSVLDACHIPQVLRLGFNCDAEGDDNASNDTQGDDTDQPYDDEDGVRPTGTWADTTDGGHIEIIVTGCSGTCYLNGWINWNSDSDSDFDDAGEHVFTDEPLGSGTHDLDFDIPSGVTFDDDYYYARFRICESSGECDTVTAQDISNGEIEDYRWYWGPTAITLTDITARSSTLYAALGAVALAAVGLMGAVVILRRRRA